MSCSEQIRAVLVDVVNDFTRRPPALRAIPQILYPSRQIQVEQISNEIYTVKIFHRYKSRSRAIPVDTEELRITLNALLPNGLYVFELSDEEFFIQLKLRRYS